MDVGVAIYYGNNDSVTAARENKGYHKDYTGKAGRDVIVYAINYAGERIGTEADVDILSDYLEDGYAVIVVDFNKNPLSCSPNIEHSLARIHSRYVDYSGENSEWEAAANENYFYTLPSGYRLARGVWYWNLYYYSSLGTRQSTVNSWNSNYYGNEKISSYYTAKATSTYKNASGTTVTRTYEVGQAPIEAENIQDCVMKDGSNLEYDQYLDIIYPSKPNKATPVYLMAASSTDLQKMSCIEERCTFTGFAFQGYTVSVFEYVYKPMVHSVSTGMTGYGYDSQNIVKIARAAIRCVRYYAQQYGYDPLKVGVAGISKASKATAVLSVIGNDTLSEWSAFALDTAARAQYGVAAAFEGDIIESESKRLTLNEPFLYYDVPYGPILDKDGNTQRDIYGNLITYDYYGANGARYDRTATTLDLLSDPNARPAGLEESETGFRTNANISFDDYTKNSVSTEVSAAYCAAGEGSDRYFGIYADKKKAPLLLSCGSTDEYGCFSKWYQTLDAIAQNANAPYFPNTMIDQGHAYPNGYDMAHDYVRHDAYLQFFHHYLKPDAYNYADLIWMTPTNGNGYVDADAKIELKFYDEIDIESVRSGVVIRDSQGVSLSGSWASSEVNTRFTFTPSQALTAGESYTVLIPVGAVKTTVGEGTVETYKTTFAVASTNAEKKPIANAFVSSASKDKAYHDDTIYQTILKVDGNCRSFVTFNKTDLEGMTQLRFESVYQPIGSEASFEVVLHDNTAIDSTLTYNSRPQSGSSLGVVTLDEQGYGTLDISALSLSNENEKVTFELVKKTGNISFESLASRERGVGVTAIGTVDLRQGASTVFATTVSKANPTAVAGALTEVVITDDTVGIFSFDIQGLAGEYELRLPVSGASQVSLYLLSTPVTEGIHYKDYKAISSTYLGKIKAKDGVCTWDVSELIAQTSGNIISFAVAPAVVHSETFTGLTATSAVTTKVVPTFTSGNSTPTAGWGDVNFSKPNDNGTIYYRAGSNDASKSTKRQSIGGSGDDQYLRTNVAFRADSKTGTTYTGRVKFYNFFGDTMFTANDVNRKFKITFDYRYVPVEAHSSVKPGFLYYGVMNAYTFTDAAGTKHDGSTYIVKNTISESDIGNEWKTLTFEYTLDEKAVSGQYGMLTFDWNINWNYTSNAVVGYFDLDNISVIEIIEGEETATISAAEVCIGSSNATTDSAGKLISVGITAGEDLTLNIYATLADEAKDATLKVTRNGKTVELSGTYVEAKDRYWYRYTGITPQCMGDDISLVLAVGDTVIDTLENYSVKAYFEGIYDLYDGDDSVSVALRRLVSDMLVYGAATQCYTNYKKDALVTDAFVADGYTMEPSSAEVIDSTPFVLGDPISDTVAITSAGVEFSNNNRLYFLFKADSLDGITLTIDGGEPVSYAETQTQGVYIAYSQGFSALEFDKIHEVVLSNGVSSQTLRYSVNNYAARKTTSGSSEQMRALAKATYYYGLAAEAYALVK